MTQPLESTSAAAHYAQERRLHPLTPLRRAWVPVAIITALVSRDLGEVGHRLQHTSPLALTAGALGLVALGVLLGFFSWWFTYFAVTDTELRIRTGLVFRRTAHIKLDRIQAVDVTQSLLARVLGLASLKLDVVGASESDVLAYLDEEQARALRSELLQRAAGPAQPTTAEAPPAAQLLHVPPRYLALALVLWDHVALQLLVALVVAGGVIAAGVPGALLVLVPLLFQAVTATVGRFLKEYDWTLWATPQGLTIDRGLLERAHETVPVGRVQTVRLVEPFFWRRLGWMRVEMHVAGSDNTVLVPVAPRAVVLDVLARVLLGYPLPRDADFTRSPRRAAWCLPVWWRGRLVAVTPGLLVTRSGLVTHRTLLVPHAKAQSIRLTQGPWQRAWRLADVHLDAAAGRPVTARLRPVDEAQRMLWEQSRRSRTGRRHDLTR